VIGIFGAGAIGCWMGGRLASGGADVVLVGRPRVMAEVADGVRVSDVEGAPRVGRVRTATAAAALADATIVIVTVKSKDTTQAARELAPIVRCPVVSLQNGVRNAAMLAAELPGRRVLAAMVPFNVVRRGPGEYHRATGGKSGALAIEDVPEAAELVAACAAAELAIHTTRDIASVQWAKLLFNLNNALNALSGLPLAEQLSQRAYRRCFAACQREALAAMRAAGIHPAKLSAIPPSWMPRLLSLPDAIFTRLARSVIAVDPAARSSMSDDFAAGRETEIDYLQGEVVALAARAGTAAPVNARVIELVRGPRRAWSADEMAAALLSSDRTAT
jgi:2-dehydropantoate 2-reductase